MFFSGLCKDFIITHTAQPGGKYHGFYASSKHPNKNIAEIFRAIAADLKHLWRDL